METELHFLKECSKYTDIWTVFYDKIQQIHSTFKKCPDQEKLAYLFGEHKTCFVFAAQYAVTIEEKPLHLPWADVSITRRIYYASILLY